jgi:glycogen phosphorylase
MSNPTYSTFSSEVQGSDALTQLALDLHWSWNHSADDIWKRIDPELWELTGNPWLILQAVSQHRLDTISDPAFREYVEQLLAERNEKRAALGWFQKAHPNSPLRTIVYFSMEYMLSEALPIYSGGLGNVAGDQLKAASDLGVPVIALGLLYQQGYFRQEIDHSGEQLELYPVNEPGQLPIRPVRTADGEWLRMRITLPGAKIWVRTWQVDVGRARLYLMDTNDPANLPQHRGITSELYGGGPELRLKQEMLLGITGWRLLRTLGIPVDVCHLNEGHAAFALLERARAYMKDTGRSFHEALAVTRAGNVFTTHTAVDAGFDRFAPELIRQYLSRYAQEILKISINDFLAMGRSRPENDSEPFNMAYLAIRGSGSVNGVSRLHGKVSRRLFQPLFPGFPESEVPVGYVTNGIHVPTWDSSGADHLWTELCGKGTWRGSLETTGKCFRTTDDSRLWEMRTAGRRSLVEYARQRFLRQEAGHGASPMQLQASQVILDDETLTLGFARRFATYKRPALLLQDPDRLARILTNPQKPVQLVLAGKAHPKDMPGQELICAWIRFIHRPDVRSHVVFLSDYDMLLAERLVEGVDVWVNTPRRPWEASGTSGMKVLVNGGLNLSVLDGWWAEAYSPAVGWAIGDGNEHGDDSTWDRADAEALYSLLENEIIPEFYNRDEKGIPRAWVARIRESMSLLTPAFSANRTVRQYTEEQYLPAAAAYAARAAGNGTAGASLVEWQREIAKHWNKVQFGELKITTQDGEMEFEVEVCLGGLDPGAVCVQLFADPRDGGTAFRQEMQRKETRSGNSRTYIYSTRAPATRPAADFTPRIIPHHPMAGPLEVDRIVWQK